MKNTEDMSREDKISQLFINNNHKLEELPSSDLWDKIESRLNLEKESVSIKKQPGSKTVALNFKKYIPYLVAAVVLVLIIVSIPFFNKKEKNTVEIAENTPPVEDVIIPEETLPTSELEKTSAFENKDRLQKEKILETAKKNASESKKAEKLIEEYGLEKIEINEKSEDLIVLSVEPAPIEDKSYIAKPKVENIDMTNRSNNSNVVSRSEYQSEGRSYANPPVMTMNDNVNNITTTNSINKTNSTGPIFKTKAKKRANSDRLEGQLQIFEWILGQWIDIEEEGGKTTENWRKINNNNIECTGVKIIGNNKIFEEKLSIYLDKETNLVYLSMPVDDYKKTLKYVLVSHNLDRIVFEQTQNTELPRKVIFQRNLNGYSVIINADSLPIKPAQQSYFEHRNRVSDSRILRVLTPAE